jgi:DNA-binding MarR family transcriptional regulator
LIPLLFGRDWLVFDIVRGNEMSQKSWLQDKDKRRKWMEFMQGFNPQIDPQTIRLMDELSYISRSIYHMSEQSVVDAGLSFAQYKVLMHLFFAEQMGNQAELNPSQISERQGVSRNTMSTFIRSLEGEGLVERRLDPHDRRRFNISLTDAGRALVSQHTHWHLESIDHYFGALSADEQKGLLTLLQKLGARVAAARSND